MLRRGSSPASLARTGVVLAVVMLLSAAGLVLAGGRDVAVVVLPAAGQGG